MSSKQPSDECNTKLALLLLLLAHLEKKEKRNINLKLQLHNCLLTLSCAFNNFSNSFAITLMLGTSFVLWFPFMPFWFTRK